MRPALRTTSMDGITRKSISASISRRAILVSAAAALPAGRLLAGQFTPAHPSNAPQSQPLPQPESQPTFSTDVKVVNVFAAVRDKQGQIIRNLNKDDFTLEDNGQPQTIRYFAQQTDLPLTLGLLVDTSGSERRMIPTERDASSTFVEQVLRPDRDKIFLIHFDREVELLQDLTSSREAIEKALDQLNSPQWGRGGQSGGYGGGGQGGYGQGGYGGGRQGGYGGGGYGRQRGGHGGTALYDAIYLASNDMMKKQTGRKALILLTDGEDNGSKVSLSEAVSSAQRADALAYSVRIADDESAMNPFMGPGMGRHGGWGGPGRGGYSNRPDGKKILQQISRETGGGYFEVSKKKTVDAIYAQIEEELRNQYSIGYTPQPPPSDGEYRKIQLAVKNKNYIVQARDGYYANARNSS